ncbi:MAG: 50S ribosomal protein L10 [Candidatus Glassbacteria bacterium RIFCSPLOWO2_12_FULL_58_11]|uniref:Large ribosomal subunit protein uL10 n=2 Tax=Candidatus Glassiibacteriota TaxID=1817805 RepID=A0A1F5Z2H5_9BACT|nr:MAG: 50S ribosomal protein L10 [Candidatus Glassbacteria bacterium GWA2_58_10]OGG06575.1 MAG: 50S ribosomal protein L10 [Candidatus Glassbacteria bacterium RIFCSPLOWO2_12_FULL_58_11]
MLRKEKSHYIEDLKKKLAAADSIILTDFTGVNVKDISELRRQFRQASSEYLVAKNTLIKRAVADTPLEVIGPYLAGPTSLVLAGDDGVKAAKIIVKFAEEHQSFAVKAGVLSQKLFVGDQVKKIASLPSKEVLVSKLLGCLNSPVTSLVFVLNDTIARAVRVLDKVRQAKQVQENS